MNQRLTGEQAQAILDRVMAGELQKDLATEFRVTPSTISNLVTGRSWPNLNRLAEPPKILRGAKLHPEDIPIIFARLARMEKPSIIALDYGVTRQAIVDIRRGKTWSHIPRPEPPKPSRRKVWEEV